VGKATSASGGEKQRADIDGDLAPRAAAT